MSQFLHTLCWAWQFSWSYLVMWPQIPSRFFLKNSNHPIWFMTFFFPLEFLNTSTCIALWYSPLPVSLFGISWLLPKIWTSLFLYCFYFPYKQVFQYIPQNVLVVAYQTCDGIWIKKQAPGKFMLSLGKSLPLWFCTTVHPTQRLKNYFKFLFCLFNLTAVAHTPAMLLFLDFIQMVTICLWLSV